MDITNEITIETWLYSNDGSDEEIAVNKEPIYRLISGEGGKKALGGMLNINGAWTSFDTGENLPVQQWLHTVITWDGNTGVARIYLNGVLKKEWTGYTGTLNSNNNPVIIGNYIAGGGYPFKGIIDEVRIYNKALA